MIPISKQARAILTGLVETFDAIDRVNGLEQRESQLQASIADLTKTVEAQRAELSKEANATAMARAEALAILEQAKTDGETIKRRMAAEGEDILAAAKDAAAKAKAKENASEAAERKAKAGLAEAEKLLADMAPKLAEAQAVIARADRITAAAKA